jgi:predicted transcriptional regulator of viral defense system
MKFFENYIKKVRQSGKLDFTLDDIFAELGPDSKEKIRSGLYRLKKKGDIISPARGLYVIVPPEDQTIGCIPAEQLVPILMGYRNAPYYAGLLTAAMYHGASHQKPQVFQVITNQRIKPFKAGHVRIEFIYKKSLVELPLQKRIVKTGYLDISSPELTIYDLLQYPHHAAGLNNIATILSEIIEVVDRTSLLIFAKQMRQQVWIQRLGYILDTIETVNDKKKDDLLRVLENYLKPISLYYVPLVTETPTEGAPKNPKWMVIENTTIESDI